MEHGKPLKMPSRTSSSPQKCKIKQSRIYITLHRETRNSVNGTKNGANMPEEPTWMMLLRCTHSKELWMPLFTTNYSKYPQCQIRWPDLLRKPENSIKTGILLLALLGVSDDRTYAFGKSWKKNLRSTLYYNLLLSDRTKDEDKDADMEEAVDEADLLWNNNNITFVTIHPNFHSPSQHYHHHLLSHQPSSSNHRHHQYYSPLEFLRRPQHRRYYGTYIQRYQSQHRNCRTATCPALAQNQRRNYKTVTCLVLAHLQSPVNYQNI